MSLPRLVLAIAVASAGLASPARAEKPAVRPQAAPAPVALPAPKTDGAFSVEKALKQRRSQRNLQPAPLTAAELGQLCWAAQGVTDDKGHRTAPSAMATYPLTLYVIAGAVEGVAPGVYRYLPATHQLEPVAAGDKRAELNEKAIGQSWMVKAPVTLVLAGDSNRVLKTTIGLPSMWIEAGLAAQGFFLQATALGLGSTYIGGFKPAEARAVLGLPASQEVLAVLPVGRIKK